MYIISVNYLLNVPPLSVMTTSLSSSTLLVNMALSALVLDSAIPSLAFKRLDLTLSLVASACQGSTPAL